MFVDCILYLYMYQTVGEPRRHGRVCSRDGVTAGARMANPKSGPALNLEDYHCDFCTIYFLRVDYHCDEAESGTRVIFAIVLKKFAWS